ncbi:MAG: PocR ligand-binding domain-containing protein [Clostridia bacterium]|nr:PocR ligand-binding domain-containing protein [Clostridia bacterium]
MNHNEITSVLSELHRISGFRISLHGVNFEEIAAYPEDKRRFCAYIQNASENERDKCVECDKISCKRALDLGETIIYKCPQGLVEAISPLYNFGALTGFLMMGQVRLDTDAPDTQLLTLIRLGKQDFDARAICAEIPTVREDMLNSYVHIMTICAQYLTLSNAVSATKPTVAQLALRYVSENYTERISINDICKSIGYSKSTVLTSFKREFGTTVNTYLNNMRLNHAKKMLDDSTRTINEVALSSGFSDQSYFSKMFSKLYGITPSDYRRREDV